MAGQANIGSRPDLAASALLESLPAAAYICGADGHMECCNRLAVELWGRTPNFTDSSNRYGGALELRSLEGEPIAPEASCTAIALQAGVPREGRQVVVVRPDGSRRTVTVYARPLVDAARSVVGVTTVLVDVTERLATEAALRDSERNFRGFFDNAAVGAAQCDMQGRYIRVNDRYCELTGYSRDELLTMQPFDLDHPDEVEADIAQVVAFVTGSDSVYRTQKRYVRKDGQVVWVEVAAHLLRDKDGRPVGSAAIVFDVSERVQLEQSLRQADRMKDEFLSTLAHELRNPLAPLSNSLALLKHRGHGDEALLDMMRRQVTLLSRLVEDLLDVARITKDKMELRKQRVSLAQILESAAEATSAELEAHRQKLVMVLPAGPRLELDADPVRLTQVFTNLLVNAAKFTDGPGTVRLMVTADGARVQVTIADSGIGMTREDLGRIFEKFYQSPHQHGRANQGVGIGLALARRLLEMHGGTITATSRGLGQGSEFIVDLPQANTAVAAKRVAAAEHRVSRKRILIVDDSRDAADSLCRLLSAMGHTATVAYDGPTAVEAAHRERPHVVLLDLGMPHWNGFEVCARLRANSSLCDTRIVALTSWGSEEDRMRTRGAGFDAHLVKPADIWAIDAVLEPQVSTVDAAAVAGRR